MTQQLPATAGTMAGGIGHRIDEGADRRRGEGAGDRGQAQPSRGGSLGNDPWDGAEVTFLLGPLAARLLVAVAGGPAAVAITGAVVASSGFAAARSPLLPSA